MKKAIFLLIFTFGFSTLFFQFSTAQCSICTKTAQQMGDGPATGLNAGIIYLAAMPFLIFSYIGYRWWKSNK